MPAATDQDNAPSAAPSVSPKMIRRAVSLITLVLLVLALWITTDREAIRAWKAEAGPVPFFIALTVLPAIGFPATPFFVLAGALYGIWVGLLGTAAAVGANLLLCYWLANGKMRPWLERILSRSKYRLPNFAASRSNALRFTVLMRIAPGLPTFAKNYAVGMTGVPFRIYFGVSFVLTMLYAASFIVLGESIFDRDFSSMGIVLGVLALAGIAALWIKVRRGRVSP